MSQVDRAQVDRALVDMNIAILEVLDAPNKQYYYMRVFEMALWEYRGGRKGSVSLLVQEYLDVFYGEDKND